MPSLLATDETFLKAAPARFSETFQIAKPADQVWAELISDSPLSWCRALSIRWTSPRPFTVGTTREAKILGGALTIQETYFLWEEGRRKTFYAASASLPVFRRLAEDYVVEPTSENRSSLTWTIAIEPSAIGKAGGPANALLVKSLFNDTRRHFASPR